VTIYKDSELKF